MPPLPPPSWGPADVLGPQAPVVPLLDPPAGTVGDLGPGTLDLSLPTDQALFAAAAPDPQQQFALIRDGRPAALVETATKLSSAGANMDISAAHSQAALGGLGSAFTDNGAPVYDPATHWGALPPDYRDAGTRLTDLGRRLTLVSDAISGAQTSAVIALNTLSAGLAGVRTRWSGEIDAARGPGGLIPYDRIGALLARRAQLAAQMQADTTATGHEVHDLVEGYENELRSLLTVLADTGHVPMTLDGPDTGLQITPPAPGGPWAQVFPIGDGLPTLEGGYTPLPGLAPPPLVNVPAPLGPSATDQGPLGGPFPGLLPGGAWYDRNSGPPDGQDPGQEAGDQDPPEPPAAVAGLTGHGHQQALERDGHGVSDAAIEDAVSSPLQPPTYTPDRYGGTFAYEGRDAFVVLNSSGEVVTTWATNREGWRH